MVRIKRITLEVEVPLHTVEAQTLLEVLRSWLDRQGIPHQEQIASVEMSPNTQIGGVK